MAPVEPINKGTRNDYKVSLLINYNSATASLKMAVLGCGELVWLRYN